MDENADFCKAVLDQVIEQEWERQKENRLNPTFLKSVVRPTAYFSVFAGGISAVVGAALSYFMGGYDKVLDGTLVGAMLPQLFTPVNFALLWGDYDQQKSKDSAMLKDSFVASSHEALSFRLLRDNEIQFNGPPVQKKPYYLLAGGVVAVVAGVYAVGSSFTEQGFLFGLEVGAISGAVFVAETYFYIRNWMRQASETIQGKIHSLREL